MKTINKFYGRVADVFNVEAGCTCTLYCAECYSVLRNASSYLKHLNCTHWIVW